MYFMPPCAQRDVGGGSPQPGGAVPAGRPQARGSRRSRSVTVLPLGRYRRSVDSRTAPVGVGLGLFAAAVIYLGGPRFFVLGLPVAVAALLLGLQSLALERTAAGFAASGLGLLALLVPVAQFASQS